jgi:hypothetical protein
MPRYVVPAQRGIAMRGQRASLLSATYQGIRPCSGKTAFLVAMMAWSTGSAGL